jgi:DNA-binding CsgD family transcriptional regulator
VGKSPGLLLLDSRCQVVFANDEALSALQHCDQDQGGCNNASAMRNMQDLVTRFTTEDKVPSEFIYAGRAWHSIRFALPNGSKPEMMSALVIGPVKAVQSHATTFAQMFHLTPRETEALELFMKGFSVKETAARMKISGSTAKAFLRLITIKMGVSGRAEMMSNVLSYMCAASLTCPFRTAVPVHARTNPKD